MAPSRRLYTALSDHNQCSQVSWMIILLVKSSCQRINLCLLSTGTQNHEEIHWKIAVKQCASSSWCTYLGEALPWSCTKQAKISCTINLFIYNNNSNMWYLYSGQYSARSCSKKLYNIIYNIIIPREHTWVSTTDFIAISNPTGNISCLYYWKLDQHYLVS